MKTWGKQRFSWNQMIFLVFSLIFTDFSLNNFNLSQAKSRFLLIQPVFFLFFFSGVFWQWDLGLALYWHRDSWVEVWSSSASLCPRLRPGWSSHLLSIVWACSNHICSKKKCLGQGRFLKDYFDLLSLLSIVCPKYANIFFKKTSVLNKVSSLRIILICLMIS